MTAPEEYNTVILGTGLTESILSAYVSEIYGIKQFYYPKTHALNPFYTLFSGHYLDMTNLFFILTQYVPHIINYYIKARLPPAT